MKKYIQLLFPVLLSVCYCGAQNAELWGTTVHGGTTTGGSIFSYNLCSGSYTVRYTFDSTYYSGCCAQGGLTQANNGLLYGLTYSCGDYDGGILYSYNIATGSLTPLHSFGNGTDGNEPWFTTPIQASNGLLYGMTWLGGADTFGTIFSYNPVNNAYAVVHNFAWGDSDGAYPFGSNLLQVNDSLLYGMTSEGPSGGTIFSFNINTNQEKMLAQCGGGAEGTLYHASNGLYYGFTEEGGLYDDGTIFSFNDVTDSVTELYAFGGEGIGLMWAAGRPIQIGDSLLCGVLRGSQIGYGGAIFSFNIFTDTMIILNFMDYDPARAEPIGYFTMGPDSLWYVNCSGNSNSNNYGAIMRYDPATNTILNVHDFMNVPDGAYPGQGLLLINDTILSCVPQSYTTSQSICQGDTLYWGNHAYAQAGVYVDTLAQAGCGQCDSIVTLTLTVRSSPPPSYVYDTICSNQQPSYFGNQLLDTTGIYVAHFYSADNCDSMVTLNLTVKPAPYVWFTWDSLVNSGTFFYFNGDTTYAEWCATTGEVVKLSGGSPPGGVYGDGGWLVNNNVITAPASGANDAVTYTYTAPNGCSANAYLNLDITVCTDIRDVNSGFSIYLYPNPATDLLYIQTEGIQPQTTHIYNVSGQLVSATPFAPQIDVSALSAGVYVVEVSAAEGTARRRFVKF